jgi:hypothetical protein
MKILPTIIIGTYAVEASAQHSDGSVLDVTVRSGEESITRKLNHQGTHDHSEQQFEKDVNDFAAKLAVELAARMRSSELARKFAGTP